MLQNVFGDVASERTTGIVSVLLGRIANILGYLSPDTSGRLRVVLADGASSIAGMGSVGGYNAQYDQYGQMMQGAMNNRAFIQVS